MSAPAAADPDSPRAGSPPFRLGASLSRAAFLACSWTWCIGMWLPTYLIHDFGWPGWAAFAVPNVVGAAAVGFVHRRPGSATAFVRRGLEPKRWFSVVTIAFHLAFLGWMAWEHLPSFLPGWSPLLAAPLCLATGWGLSRLGSRAWGSLAALTLALAPIVMLLMFITTEGNALAPPPGEGVVIDPIALPLFGIGLAFGFLLCPHLDLTILRVREETPGATGDAAFLLGFGGFFFAMIAFSALYASGVLLGWFSYYLLAHFFIQSTFTVGAHCRELRERGWPRLMRPPIEPAPPRRTLGPPIGFLLIALACTALAGAPSLLITAIDKPPTRALYESFLWFYALPLPAAAWFLLLGRRLGAWFWGSAALATPAIAAGGFMGIWWAVPIGVGLPILAGLAAPRRDAGIEPRG